MPGPRSQTVALEALGQSLGAVHEVEGLDILQSHGGQAGEGPSRFSVSWSRTA